MPVHLQFLLIAHQVRHLQLLPSARLRKHLRLLRLPRQVLRRWSVGLRVLPSHLLQVQWSCIYQLHHLQCSRIQTAFFDIMRVQNRVFLNFINSLIVCCLSLLLSNVFWRINYLHKLQCHSESRPFRFQLSLRPYLLLK